MKGNVDVLYKRNCEDLFDTDGKLKKLTGMTQNANAI